VGWGPEGDDYIAIATGNYHGLALKSDGSIVGWGRNSHGEIDIPSRNDYVGMDGGSAHSIAILSDGSLVGWGDNFAGRATPPKGNDFTAIAVGSGHNLALKSDRTIVAWGENDFGQCNVPSGSDFIAIAADYDHSLALKSDGSIFAWGHNDGGQCDVPPGNNFVAISAGPHTSFALRSDGSLVAWGYYYYLGPVPPGNDFIAIASGLEAHLALKSDGSIVAWGTNSDIVNNLPSGNNFVDIKASWEHAFALTREPVIEAAVDIKPTICPNPVNVKSEGVLPVAILGSGDFDVNTIDVASIRLADVASIRSSFEDVATSVLDENECDCTTEGPDGYIDLTLKFETQQILEALGDVSDGDELELNLTGVLYSGVPIEGADCIVVRGKFKSFNSADLNKDGMVDSVDFAVLAENWLKSSIEQD
jgi:hypothetical protein